MQTRKLQACHLPKRRCTRCGITKSLDQFYEKPTRYKDGSPKYRAQCIQCMRARALTIYHQVKGRKVRKVSTPLCASTQPLCASNRPLTRLPQRPPLRTVQPSPRPAKPPTSQGVRRDPLVSTPSSMAQERHYVVDEYSQVDPNEDL